MARTIYYIREERNEISMEVLIFQIRGDFGHFRKYYTTSSPLTFAFPPPPTIKGMLAAVAGIDKTEYLSLFSQDNCSLAVALDGPVKKIRLALNHINTKGDYWVPVKKGAHEARTQIRTELLKDPSYTIYFAHKDKGLFNTLAQNIQEHKTVFTLSLGLSELLADFSFVGVCKFQLKQNITGEIYTVVPMSLIVPSGIIFEGEKKYFKEKIPVEMNRERVVERYEDVLFEAQGKPLKVRLKECWEGEDGRCITFF